MAGEGVEVRQLSLQADAKKLVDGLIQGGKALNEFSTVVGKSDKQLRQTEKAIDKAGQQMATAAVRAQRMKNEIKELNKVLTSSHRESAVLAAKLTTANRKLAEQQAIVRTKTAVIKSLATQNGALATSYDKITGAATRANAAMARTQAGSLGSQFANATPLAATPYGVFANGVVPLKEINKQLTGTASAANAATKSVNGTAGAFGLAQGGLNALRYQLYGVTAAYGILGAAVSTAGLAIIRSGIEWDKNFANVIRTSQVTGLAVEWLKDQFLDLQTTIPVTAADLATIGTLGSQMGVVAGNLTKFTATTAKFSATAEVGVEESATALSRLDQLLPDVNGNYERLASTILLTGVNAVATERQIIRGTSQIAAMGRIAGLTTPEIVALSSTLSSLGFSPELQRSVITSSFSRILTATSTVTEKTEKFGEVLNLTGKQFQQAWNEDAIGTYKRLMETIAGRGDAVTVLQSLGLASQRLTPNLLKLGQNTEVLDEALGDTARGWSENNELARQYGIISDTVSARMQVLAQTWDAFLVTLDSSDTVLKPLIEGLTGLVRGLRNIAKNPAIGAIATIGTVITAAAGAMILGTAATAALSAGYIAVIEAQAGMKAFVAAGTAATLADAEVTGLDAAAQLELTGALAARTVAVDAVTGATIANTEATAANGVVVGATGQKLLSFSSSAISALPVILKWAGVIGLLAGAFVGLGVVVANAPDWIYDIQKGLAGASGSAKTFQYDVEKLNEAFRFDQAREDEYKVALKADPADKERLDGIIENYRKLSDVPMITKDLEEEILALGDVGKEIAAVNQVADDMGVSQAELLALLPGVASAIGDEAVAMTEAADAAAKLESAQALWAASLGTTDENLVSLMDGVQSAAGSFLDFGSSLTDAYDDGGGGINAFLESITTKLSDFEDFYGDLGTLVQSGGVQLAAFFASQGPTAAQALTDSLALSPEQIAQVEDQMTLAAFYASDAFKQTFAQNQGLLAQVWEQSGHDPAAVAAFNTALNNSMVGGSIDPAVLASLASQYGIELPIEMIPDIDPGVFDAALALQTANITPIKVPIESSLNEGVLTQEVDAWVVEMEGHSITLPVDPNTDEGRQLIAEWRENEYETPLSIQTFANTYHADKDIGILFAQWNNRTITLNVRSRGGIVVKDPTAIATGGLIKNGDVHRTNYPKFARGSVLRGPGSGTSDSILARVSNGEAITRARAVRFYGSGFFEDLNNLRFPRFAGGGFYGSSPGNAGGGTTINATVVQNYPTTRDPIKKMKQDAESVLAGIWM